MDCMITNRVSFQIDQSFIPPSFLLTFFLQNRLRKLHLEKESQSLLPPQQQRREDKSQQQQLQHLNQSLNYLQNVEAAL